MSDKVRARGYRKFRDWPFVPNPRFSILVEDNESEG